MAGVSISSLTFKPNHTQEDIKVSWDWLEKQRPTYRTAVAVFAIVGQGKVQDYTVSGICHRGLGVLSHGKGVSLVATMIHPVPEKSYNTDPSSQEASDAYFDYLANRSPLSRFIIEMRPDLGCLVSATTPKNLLATACIASRANKEHHSCVVVWHLLVQKGLSEDLAYLLAFTTTASPNGFKSGVQLRGKSNNHTVLCTGISLKCAQMWMSHCIHKDKEGKPYNVDKVYGEIHPMWAGYGMYAVSSDEMLTSALTKAVRKIQRGPVAVLTEKIVNPFAKAMLKTSIKSEDAITLQELLENVGAIKDLGLVVKSKSEG